MTAAAADHDGTRKRNEYRDDEKANRQYLQPVSFRAVVEHGEETMLRSQGGRPSDSCTLTVAGAVSASALHPTFAIMSEGGRGALRVLARRNLSLQS